jgi:hypothetical protein
MAIRVYKVADIAENRVLFPRSQKFKVGDVAAILTGLGPIADPVPGSSWTIALVIGEGSGVRRVELPLKPLIGKSTPIDIPVLLGEDEVNGHSLFYFRDRLFMSERSSRGAFECDEVELRIKKIVYDEDFELSSLRAAVANLEAAIEFQKSGPKLDPIPEEVKLLVRGRDGGCCVRCGSKQELQFDYIIPVPKGGGNSEANIQILCQTCNLKKSDKIAMT